MLATIWRTTGQGLMTLKNSSSAFQAMVSPPALWNTCLALRFAVSPRPLIRLPDSGDER
jgi:hypothetical protein